MPALLLFSCDPSGDGGGGFERTVTGVVSVTTNAKVGAFSSDYWFYSNSDPTNVVDREFGGGGTGLFPPLYYVLPDGAGNYTIDLPENPPDMGELIAWVDDGDGVLELGTEIGCLPEKNIEGTDRVITGFGWINWLGDYYYLVSYTDGEGAQNDGFDIVGTNGFNFNIP